MWGVCLTLCLKQACNREDNRTIREYTHTHTHEAQSYMPQTHTHTNRQAQCRRKQCVPNYTEAEKHTGCSHRIMHPMCKSHA